MSTERVHLVWASEELLATEAAEALAAAAAEDAEVLSMHAEPSEVPGLAEALTTPSLFGPRRVVVVREAERLTAAGAKGLGSLLTADLVPEAVIVVAVSERPPTTLQKALEAVAKVHKVPKPQRGELVRWVADRMKASGLTPGRDAAGTFIEAVGSNLRELDGAIKQIAIRAGRRARVDREHVLAHFRGTSEQPMWALFDALASKDAGKAYAVLRSLFAHGEEPIPLLGALVSQVRYILRAKGVLDRWTGVGDADLAHALGVSAARAAVLRRQAGKLRSDWLVAVHDLCVEADVELKGGEDGAVLPPEIVLERLVGRATAA